MIQLLIYNPAKALITENSLGGLPVQIKNHPYTWPVCAECQGDMRYMGKIKTDLGLDLIFICENDPGMCGDEDPDGGANQVITLTELTSLEEFTPDNIENTLRQTEYSSTIVEVDSESYDEARLSWHGEPQIIIGQINGRPDWIQGDETPECNCCQKPMRFVAQLEEGPDHRTAMNFGGGSVAFLFDCPQGKTAKFLWQC